MQLFFVDPCLSQPCINGGYCSSSNSSFYCQCPYGYSGYYCEETCKNLVLIIVEQ